VRVRGESSVQRSEKTSAGVVTGAAGNSSRRAAEKPARNESRRRVR